MKSVMILLALFTMFLTLGADDSVEDNATRSDCEMIHGHRLPPEPDPKINNSTLLGIAPNAIDVKEGTTVQLSAIGRYDNENEKNLTTKVEWSVGDSQVAAIDGNGTLSALKEGSTAVHAVMSGVDGNASLTVYKEMYGHRLPPEPDPQVNNSTLLGIDSNNNGVRDDVERWIYTRYDKHIPCEMVQDGYVTLPDGSTVPTFQKVCAEQEVPYHQIVREIAMQGARAAQIVIVEPERAKENTKYMDAAVQCDSYFGARAKYHDEPILFDTLIEGDYSIIGNEFDSVQFNTVMRARAYGRYNHALSGGVYSANETGQEMRASCDFDVDGLLGK